MKKYFSAFLAMLFVSSIPFSTSTTAESSTINDAWDGEEIAPLISNEILVSMYKEEAIEDQDFIDESIADGDYIVREDGTIVIYDTRRPEGISTSCIACVGGRYEVKKTAGPSTVYGSWIIGTEGKGPATLKFSKSVSWSNSYSGTLSVSKSLVNAAVGFDITKSGKSTASYSVKVPAKKTYQIQYRRVYKKYTVRQRYYVGNTLVKTTYVYPRKYSHIGYRSISK